MNTVYNTATEMFYKMGLDSKHWINKEQLPYLKQNVYTNTQQRFMYCPEHLLHKEFICKNDHRFTPSWLEKRHPIMPFYDQRGGLIRPYKTFIQCPVCNDRFTIDLPTSDHKGSIEFYGDEAIRDNIGTEAPKALFTYSVINKPKNAADNSEFLSRFHALKQMLHTDKRTAKTPLHMKELWNEKARSKGIYKNVTDNIKYDFVKSLADLINEFSGKMVIFNCAGVYFKPTKYNQKDEQTFKSLVYTPLLLRVIEDITKQGLSPHFFFERTTKDGWAKNLFKGGRLTLMWPFVCHGIPVGSPQFVHPNHSEYLEIADFVSFSVARYIKRRAENKNIDIDLSLLGKVYYQGYTEDSICFCSDKDEYPWDTFFSGTNWS